jgi:hypothetical protein
MERTMAERRRRPNPLRWVWYALGGGLPAVHDSWVLYDVTARTWWLRHIIRVTVQLVPIFVLLYLLIPGPSWVRSTAVLAGAILGYLYGLSFAEGSAEHRAVKAGFPPGTTGAVRGERTKDVDEAAAARYAQRWRTPQ